MQRTTCTSAEFKSQTIESVLTVAVSVGHFALGHNDDDDDNNNNNNKRSK